MSGCFAPQGRSSLLHEHTLAWCPGCIAAAIEGLTRAMAAELPGGMAAVPVIPGIIDTEMLRSCFGADAGNYPDPAAWAEKAVPFLLSLRPKDNGKPMEVPE